ncbi:MAG: MBL fold metallo-hydrolase [Chitinivibrionales bacterium]|nr:MBL fold metallo-hydrolase [Chitinivibrionales bacterium]
MFMATLMSLSCAFAGGAMPFQSDTVKTSAGDLVMTFIGHGTLMLRAGDVVIHVDPWTKFTDYRDMPKADIILVTHEHRDHLDADAITHLRTDGTEVLLTAACREALGAGTVMANGDSVELHGLRIDAVPAYNVKHTRGNGAPFHPRGEGNGYVITFGDTRVYIAGDTEDIPEMAALKDIDIAFLPMNLPYTMTPEMAAHAAKMCKARIVYPYHYGSTDPRELVELLAEDDTEVRVRELR